MRISLFLFLFRWPDVHLLNSLPNGQGGLAVLKSRHGGFEPLVCFHDYTSMVQAIVFSKTTIGGFGGVLGPYSVASRDRD